MPGAAVLATGAALHSGCGLVTVHSVENVCNAVAFSYPSAILSFDSDCDCFSTIPDSLSDGHQKKYNVVAVGPGLGKSEKTCEALYKLMLECGNQGIRMLLDADAINIISRNRQLLEMIPEGSVMTPHDGELHRLCNISDRQTAALALASELGSVVVAKGFRTIVASADGNIYVNTTGGPGLAKAGSGDVLSGLISGLMSRGYSTLDAANLGVWIHGYVGDYLTRERTAESFDSKDLAENIFVGFKSLFDMNSALE